LALHTIIDAQKINLKKNLRWQMGAILKNVKCDIFPAIQPNLMKFGVTMPISPPNVMGYTKFKKMKIQDFGWWPF